MFKNLWNDIVNFFNNNVWDIILFFAVLVIGTVVVKILLNISRRMLKKTKMTCGIASVQNIKKVD